MTTMRTGTFDGSARAIVLAMALLGLSGCPHALAASIREPATVFYGTITGTGSARPFPVTEGELRWTFQRPNGTAVTLRTRLWPINGSEFAYRLNVPHEALVDGTVTAPGVVPLRSVTETVTVGEIRINGLPARIVGPAVDSLDFAQARRAATYRVDLEVPIEAPDRDGDGLPDWWEAKAGRDLRPGEDPDGDGVDNLREYLAGTDPLSDSRRPTLSTTRVRAYADSTTGVWLRALDSDTPPEKLIYTLTRPPAGAELRLRNALPSPAHPDMVLDAGATFTQRDVLGGRLVIVHAGGEAVSTSFDVSLRDDAPSGTAATGTIAVRFYRPTAELIARVALQGLPGPGVSSPGLAAEDAVRLRLYTLGQQGGAVLWDGTDDDDDREVGAPTSGLGHDAYVSGYVNRFGPERSQALLGGRGKDVLLGGMANDWLAGGGGANRLAGGGGADRFVFLDAAGNTDTVVDFDPAEGDVLDVEPILKGTSREVRDYVRLTPDGTGSRLGIDRDGEGGRYTDLIIHLPGVAASSLDLHEMVEKGQLVVGSLALPPRITIVASRPTAGENGPRSGEFTIVRTGKAEGAITVPLEVRGSAINGVDYASLPSSVAFADGERAIRLAVTPYLDNQAEPTETVEVTVLPGSGYEVGSANRAQVTIADLLPGVSIEAIEPFATLEPLSAGTILVSRDTVVDRSLLVRLEVRGSAIAGTDIQPVPRFVNFTPGQTTALLDVTPVAGATLAEGSRSVVVAVVPDAAYAIGEKRRAEVLVVRQPTTFAAWRARHFPGATGALAAFGAADEGGKGVSNLLRYAFGMDPSNPDRARLPKVAVRDGHLVVDVWRRPEATDVDFVAEVSSNLKDWTTAPGWVERIYPEAGGDAGVVCFRAVPAVAETTQLFFNVRVVMRP